MGWPVCKSNTENQNIHEADLWNGGITFQHLSIILGGVFGLIACGVSIYLVMSHATHYSKPLEQRHIIRILWMVPVYSLVAWLSITFYHYSVFFQVMGDCYEAFTIAAFFSLMCHYIAPDLHSQKDYFRGIQPKQWVWPLTWFKKCCGGEFGIWRTPRSGLTWFNIIWVGVFQYCLLRVLMTIVAVATEANNTYCEESLSPAFAHIWVLVVESSCVSIAMYCLIQFYIQIRKDIKQYRPFLKILSIKLVIFLSFWQSTFVNLLVSAGAVKPTPKVQLPSLKYVLPALMINIEMAVFAILHLWAFPWQPYSLNHAQAGEVTDYYGNGKASYHGGRYGTHALVEAMNPVDLLKAIGRSVRWLVIGRKIRQLDSSYRPRDETIGLRPAQETTEPGSPRTAYEGAGAAMARGRTSRQYGGPPGEEGVVLLTHAQSNPETAQLAVSPYAEEFDESAHDHPGRYYRQGTALPYDDSDTPNPEYPSSVAYPADGPLREQIPMPIPDPYQPPPPTSDSHHR